MALLCVSFKAGFFCTAAQQTLWECLHPVEVESGCYTHMTTTTSQFQLVTDTSISAYMQADQDHKFAVKKC